jgi:hypothetical protein
MRTVPVHVMWDAQEKISSRPESICGMPRTARGASYGGETLCVARSERAREQRHPGAPRRFPGTFTGHPPYSVRKARDLGMETREIPTNPYSAGVLGTADQGKAVGATIWYGRLPAMHHVSTPDPNPGRAPRRDVSVPVMCTPGAQCTV